MSNRALSVLIFAILVIATVFLFVPVIAQDPTYHEFIDTRRLLGIANFWNVASNLPFLAIGAAGLAYVRRYSAQVCVAGLETAYSVFFAGIFLTAFGSSYYHLEPGNATLVWDRLPMTIGFSGLITIIVGEFVSVSGAQRLLVPLLLLGFGSVEYWAWSEAHGVGDLRPYAIVQFLPMLLIPIILLSHRPVIGKASYYWWMILFYFVAKLLEYFDGPIFSIGQLVSGHALKHIAAAASPAVFLYALTRRR